jgi:hypothetical protein
VLALALPAAGCGGGGGGADSAPVNSPASTNSSRPVADSDLDIAQKIYSDSARTPGSFSADPVPSGVGAVSTFHLKNTDVQADSSGMPVHELCTNDWNQALSWSEEVANAAASYSDLVGTGGDDRMFEFDRQRSGNPSVYERARIYKCSYIDRTPVDLRNASGAAGILQQLPLSANGMQQLSEYLWRFTTYNNFGNAVLKSSGTTTASSVDHTLIIATLVPQGTSASCDRVDVVAWTHSGNIASGNVTRGVTALWSFGAKESAGIAQLCAQ